MVRTQWIAALARGIRIEGHFIQGYADAEDAPDKQIELIPVAAAQAQVFLDRHPDTRRRFDQVVDLVEGFETSFGMELLATVHWIAMRECGITVDQTIEKTHLWNDRKRIFTPTQIRIAWKTLQHKGWLSRVEEGTRDARE